MSSCASAPPREWPTYQSVDKIPGCVDPEKGETTDTCDASRARDVQQANDFVRYDADGLLMLVPESTMDLDTRRSSGEQLPV